MKRPSLCGLVMTCWLSVTPALCASDENVNAERIARLKQLSLIERDRVDRNIETFQTLDGDQRDQIRQLHDELLEDRKHGGSLVTIFDAYSRWLQTLSPIQREQLRKEVDTSSKIRLVRQFIDDQERQLKEEHERMMKDDHEPSRSPSDASHDAMPSVRQANPLRSLQLDKKELESVMRVMYDDLPAEKRPADFESFDLHRYTEVVSESIKLKSKEVEWPDEILRKKMTEKLSPKKVKTIATISQLGRAEERDIFVRLIFGAILKFTQEMVLKVTEEERIATLEGLKPNEQRYYEKQLENKQKGYLDREFLKKKGDESYRKNQECRKIIFELFDQLKVEPPPWIQRPSSRRGSAVPSKS